MTTTRAATLDDEPRLLELARAFPYSRRRAYARNGLEMAGREEIDAVRAALRDDSLTIALEESGVITGFASARPNLFESEHFGVGVARLSTPLTSSDDRARADAVAALLAGCLADWGRQGGALLMMDVDSTDVGALVGAQRAGFEVLEASITHMIDTDQPDLGHHYPDTPLSFTTHFPGDEALLAEIDVSRMRDLAGHAFTTSHFHADHRLSIEACDDLYMQWVDRMFTLDWADWMVIGWLGDDAVSVMGMKHLTALVDHGLTASAASLGVSLSPEGHGAMAPMARTTVLEPRCADRFREITTKLAGIAIQRSYSRLHNSLVLETHYTLHGWVGD